MFCKSLRTAAVEYNRCYKVPSCYHFIPHLPKLFETLLLNSIRPSINHILVDNQHGFRPGRSSVITCNITHYYSTSLVKTDSCDLHRFRLIYTSDHVYQKPTSILDSIFLSRFLPDKWGAMGRSTIFQIIIIFQINHFVMSFLVL